MSSLEQSDKEAGAVAVAPRVSLADIEAAITASYHFTAADAVAATKPQTQPMHDSLKLLSICIIVVENGYTVIGKSAPASAANFDAQLGRKLAYEDAIRQLWPLMGFALRDRLAAA